MLERCASAAGRDSYAVVGVVVAVGAAVEFIVPNNNYCWPP